MIKNKRLLTDLLLLVLCLLVGGIYCVLQGQDTSLDLLNYHLYNPFAFLNNRYGQDLFAAGMHTTLNPLLDVPYYLLFRALFHHPAWLTFLWGLPYGFCVWLMYKITDRIFETQKWGWKFLIVLLAATATGTFLQAGIVSGEINNLIIILTSLWCFVVFVQNPQKVKFLYWAGFLAGFAAGCKLTASYYCIALFAALFPNIRRTEKPLKTVPLFCLLGLAGFLLTNGYFMWKWYTLYGNPFFPYYNNVFHSPYFEWKELVDLRFFPHTSGQWLFYPFYWISYNRYVTEISMADIRLALGYLAAVVLAYRLWRGYSVSVNRRLVRTLLILTVVGYVVWLYKFSILRYACVIEFLACVLIFIALDSVLKRPVKIWLACLLVGDCLFCAEVPKWPRVDFGKEEVVEFNVKPEIEDNALVLLMHLPTSYLAVTLNPKATYIGGFKSLPQDYPQAYQKQAATYNNFPTEYYRYRIEDLQRAKIDRHEGPIYIIATDWPMIRNEKTLARFGLKTTSQPCLPFKTNWAVEEASWAICPVQKIGENK